MLCPQRTDDHAVAVLVPAGSEVTSRTAAVVLAQQARRPHWAARYRRALSAGQMEMLGWEDDAARVIQYHPYLLPDLVRTEDYAHAAMAADPWHRGNPGAIDERGAALMARQQRVNRAGRCVTILADARALPACDSQMMAQAGEAPVGNVVDPNYTIAAKINKTYVGGHPYGDVHRRLRPTRIPSVAGFDTVARPS